MRRGRALPPCGCESRRQHHVDDERGVEDAILAKAKLLARVGPSLKRPNAALNGSKHVNMKELRCNADEGVWRIAFAFDPERKAILLTAGDKAGINQRRFYKNLVAKADKRFDQHLAARERTK